MNTTFAHSANRTDSDRTGCSAADKSPLLHGSIKWFACVITLVLVGCGTTSQTRQAAQAPELPANVVSEGAIRFDTDDARLAELWSAAEDASAKANVTAAIDILIEALDISPRSSLIWSRAAELQLENQQSLLAENYALKSNEYAANNARLLLRNWLIIEHARAIRGDLLGVRSAHKQVQLYQYQ